MKWEKICQQWCLAPGAEEAEVMRPKREYLLSSNF